MTTTPEEDARLEAIEKRIDNLITETRAIAAETRNLSKQTGDLSRNVGLLDSQVQTILQAVQSRDKLPAPRVLRPAVNRGKR